METQPIAGTEMFKGSTHRIAKEVGSMVDVATSLVKDHSAQALQSAKARLAHAQTLVVDSATQYARLTNEYVHDNPWKVLGVAAAAGGLIGFLLSRR